MVKSARISIAALLLAMVLGSGCQSKPNFQWAGTWQSNEPGHNGDLYCSVDQVSDQQWQAQFTGYCGRYFAYDITMQGYREGDAIVFKDQVDLGESDGGVYEWTGRIEGEQFKGQYESLAGKQGTFTMARQ